MQPAVDAFGRAVDGRRSPSHSDSDDEFRRRKRAGRRSASPAGKRSSRSRSPKANGGAGGAGTATGSGSGSGGASGGSKKGAPRLDGPMLGLKEFTATVEVNASEHATTALAYDAYLRAYSKANGRRFYAAHKDEDWFLERYDPGRLTARAWALNSTAAQERYDAFLKDFKNNRRILHIDLDVPDAKASREEFYDSCILLGSVDKNVSRQQLVDLFKTVNGFRRLALNSADPAKGFSRSGYLFFESNDTARDALRKFDDYKIAPRVFLELKPCPDALSRQSAPAYTGKDAQRIEKDLQLSVKLARQLDRERGLPTTNHLLSEEVLDAITPPVRRVNAVIEYLRFVHFYDYYSAGEFADADELLERTGLAHLRDSAGSEKEPADAPDAWAVTHDKAIAARLSAAGQKQTFAMTHQFGYEKAAADAQRVRLEQFQAKGVQDTENKANCPVPIPGTAGIAFDQEVLLGGERSDALERAMDAYWNVKITTNPEKTKYKCAEPGCPKAFKGPSFVRKHHFNKHIDSLAKEVRRVQDELTWANFELDAERLTKAMADARNARDAAGATAGSAAGGRGGRSRSRSPRSPSRSRSPRDRRSRSRSPRSPRSRSPRDRRRGGRSDYQRDQYQRGPYRGGPPPPAYGGVPPAYAALMPQQNMYGAPGGYARGPGGRGAPPPAYPPPPHMPYGAPGPYGRPPMGAPYGMPYGAPPYGAPPLMAGMAGAVPVGVRSDPRALRSYSDLDAPPEGDVEIDYGFGTPATSAAAALNTGAVTPAVTAPTPIATAAPMTISVDASAAAPTPTASSAGVASTPTA